MTPRTVPEAPADEHEHEHEARQRGASASRGRRRDPLTPSRADAARRAPQLLVSVRSRAESLVALAGGASFIDVKEPSRGSLGRSSRRVQVEVARALRPARDQGRGGGRGRQVTATAALGELEASGSPRSYEPVGGYALFKLGLSGCRERRAWTVKLDRWRTRVAAVGADLAAVAYADHDAARAPEPRAILAYAIARRLPFLLVDTWGKASGTLTDFLSAGELATLLDEAHRHGVSVALAGSLRPADLPALARLGADVLAVRGAACTGGKRELGLDPERIRDLVRLLPQPAG